MPASNPVYRVEDSESPFSIVGDDSVVVREHSSTGLSGSDLAADLLKGEAIPSGTTDVGLLHRRARAAIERGDIETALDLLIPAIEAAPERAALWCDLGRAFHGMGDHPQSQAAFLQALDREPEHLDTLFHLTELLRASGHLQDALQCISALVERRSDYPGAWHLLGMTLMDMNHLDEARGCFERELARDPGGSASAASLAKVWRLQGNPSRSLTICRAAQSRDAGSAEVGLQLAYAQYDLGQHDEALATLRGVIESRPEDHAAHQLRVLAADAGDRLGKETPLKAREAWRRSCIAATGGYRAHRRAEPSRRLRIGYISAAFLDAPATRTFAPLLLEYDRTHFEVHCFANHAQEDAVTARIRASVDGFESIAALSDEQVAAAVASARIDILVDLSGHAPGNRLGVFARRPAPLQITGWGHPHGTGLPQMDYVAADARHLSADDLVPEAEKRLDIPATLGYRSFDPLPEVAPLPALSRGHLTFGACLEPGALSATTVEMWAGLLRELPNSVLQLGIAGTLSQEETQALQARFTILGIALERVPVRPLGDWTARLNFLGDVDLLLSGSSGLDAAAMLDGLAMGVPTLAVRGDSPSRRLCASLLDALDLSEHWVTEDGPRWMELALKWSQRIEALAELRPHLRQRLLDSVVGDALRYTRAVESAFREAWRGACAGMRTARARDLAVVRSALSEARFEAAWSVIEALLQGDPQDPEVLHLAGVIALQLGHQRESVDFLQSALRLDASAPEAWLALAAALTREQRAGPAAYAIEQAARLRTGVAGVR